MTRPISVLGFAGLVVQLGAGPADVLLTVPQRDAWRPKTAPATASVSGDGQHIAFVSYARLVAGDTDGLADTYVLNRLTGAVTLESLGPDGASLEGDSGHPRLSGDGRFLVFDTAVPLPDGRSSVQVIIRDRTARTSMWVSRTPDDRVPNESSNDPAISADASVVAFTSAATDLVPDQDENGIGLDVYLYDLASRHIRRVSVDSRGVQRRQGSSYAVTLSTTGRYLAFVSTAELSEDAAPARESSQPPSLPPGGHVYLRDLRDGITTRITQASSGMPANGRSWGPSISGDGQLIAFASTASNLVQGDRNRAADVFLHDRRTVATTLMSRGGGRGTANGASINPAISADGRFVAFQSDASDLICAARCGARHEDINLVFDVFVLDRETMTVSRISAGPNGGWSEESGGPAVSADGGVIAFTSRHPIDSDDVANDFDLFVRLRR